MSAVRSPHRSRYPARTAVGALCVALGCTSATTPGSYTPSAVPAPAARPDTAGRALVPPGYGTLHQDDISFHLNGAGLLVRALPLDESLIRLLTPDSYRALRDLKESNRAAIDAVARRSGGRTVSAWLVSFYGVQPDVRFTPGDLIVTSGGRDFRARDVIPLTVGFGEQRLRQRETQSALYVFDGDVEVDQPITVAYQGMIDDSWDEALQRVERERAMVRARSRRPD